MDTLAHTSGRLKVASLFSGCGVLDYGLTQAGHEIALQTESDDRARNVLAARFQGICQPRDASMVETLPADVDLLAASVMCAEMEGSWRESWSKDSAAAKLKQVLRLVKSRPVPWVLVEASTALLESDGEGVPIVCDLVSEFERLGYRWAHRTVAAAAFGVPDIRPRVLIVASRHGDPRDVLLTEDAGKMTSFEPPGADTQQAFVFNRRPDGTVRVFSDFVEGFHPGEGSCVLLPSGGLTPLDVHDAERLQGLPPGWTLTSRPPAPGTPVDNTPRWAALAASLGCVPAAQWVGSRLANPYKHKFATEGSPFEAPITVPWPPAAYNVGQGRCSVLISPFPRTVGTLPTLGGFVGAGMLASGAGTEGAVTKETALDCVRALRAAGWQPPPQLVAVEVAAEAAIAAAAVAAAAAGGAAGDAKGAGKRAAEDPGGVAAQAAALAALAPVMAAAAERGAALGFAAPVNAAAAAATANASNAAAAAAAAPAPRSKKSKTSHASTAAIAAAAAAAEAAEGSDSDGDSYAVAGITLRSRSESQVVWAKLPGHPFWPGLRVDLDRDVVPPETLAMRKENEALVIFFGENSFGWVREDQVLDFKEAYAEKAREPIRNKARFNSALQEALNDVEKRDGGFVPPAVQQRGKSGGHGHGHGHANGGGKTSGDDEKKEKTRDVVGGGDVPLAGMDPSAADAGEVMKAMAAAAAAAVASGRTTTDGCACRVCAAKGSPKSARGATAAGSGSGSGSSVCLRIEAQRAAAKHPVGAMLALQGAASVGNTIEIYWPLDHVHYTARVTSYDPVELQHMVMYEADGVREFLCLWNEDVKVLDGPTPGEGPAPSAPRDHGEKPGAAAAHAAKASAAAGGGAEAEEAKAAAATTAAKEEPGADEDAADAEDEASQEDADAALLMGLQ